MPTAQVTTTCADEKKAPEPQAPEEFILPLEEPSAIRRRMYSGATAVPMSFFLAQVQLPQPLRVDPK